MTHLVATVRSAFAHGPADSERRRVARELADFTSTADRLELEAMLERVTPEERRQLQGVLRLAA